jgi:N6-adenosine-specific RNA methylase IME4
VSLVDVGFGCILADPAWSYQNWSEAKNGASASSYECMSTESISAIPVAKWAAKDCVLYLWCTNPKLPDGLRVGESWGFEYVTKVPWVKFSPTTGKLHTTIGFFSRAVTEDLLIFRKGNPKRRGPRSGTPPGLLVDGERVFYAPKQDEHSRKPEEVHTWIERTFDGPYLELFARRERSGWTALGFDTGWRLGPGGSEPYVAPKEE